MHGVTGHRIKQLGEYIISVRLRRETISIWFLVRDDSPSILKLKALCALSYWVLLHETSSSTSDQSRIQIMITRCCSSNDSMTVDSVILNVDADPVLLMRPVLPYCQREDILNALNKMELESIIFHISSSVWATLIVMVMKSNGQTPHICVDCRLTLNPWLRSFANTTRGPEVFMNYILLDTSRKWTWRMHICRFQFTDNLSHRLQLLLLEAYSSSALSTFCLAYYLAYSKLP